MSRPADTAARSSIRAKPAVVDGAPRSERNMNGNGSDSKAACGLLQCEISIPVTSAAVKTGRE
jgi:hypothetical protein